MADTAGSSGRPLVFARGDNPILWVDVAEVAALVERAVLDRSLRGQTLEICGPEALTLLRRRDGAAARSSAYPLRPHAALG